MKKEHWIFIGVGAVALYLYMNNKKKKEAAAAAAAMPKVVVEEELSEAGGGAMGGTCKSNNEALCKSTCEDTMGGTYGSDRRCYDNNGQAIIAHPFTGGTRTTLRSRTLSM
jgi:hypothetical protein